jgi:hypothetical protein
MSVHFFADTAASTPENDPPDEDLDDDEPEEESDEPDDERDGEPDDDLTVDFAFDLDGMRLACIYTGGLWNLGIPELYLRPPDDQAFDNSTEAARLSVFLATAVIQLGYELLDADGLDVPPYYADLDRRSVRFWLGAPEPPDQQLARHLDPEVDTVIEVHCSLWHAPLLGDG